MQLAGLSVDQLSAGSPVASSLADGLSESTGVELVRASVTDVSIETSAHTNTHRSATERDIALDLKSVLCVL